MTPVIYLLAAVAEIGGCFAVWAWLLAQADTAFAGRAFAAYGGVYIAASIAWGWLAEAKLPDRWDLTGGAICLIGACLVLYGPRGA